MKHLFFYLLIIIFQYSFSQNPSQNEVSTLIVPTLFADLGETCTTPDGMAIDSQGNLYLAVANLLSFDKYGSKIIMFDKNDKPTTWFDKLPLHPITERVHPMGIEFGQDGHLYIADNQNITGLKNQSRILRIIVENGKPIKGEVLVEGLGFANGIRINNNTIYITDFMFENVNKKESGIFSFELDEINKNKVILNKHNLKKYLVSTFSVGIDGITFDNCGNLYVGHFYTGEITKFEFNKDKKVKSKKVILKSKSLNCADGIYYDKKRNSIFIANFRNNSVHQLELETNSLHLIWKNENSDGSNGLLDNPCETIIYNGNLIVANFDTFTGTKNLEVDNFNTISKFNLIKLK